MFARRFEAGRRVGRQQQRLIHQRVFELATLEQRVLLSAAWGDAGYIEHSRVRFDAPVEAAMSVPLAAGTAVKGLLTAVPALNSYSNAMAQLYLDFNGDVARTWGDFAVTTTPAYDRDGDPSTFSDGELSSIREVWARVVEKYSPFNINVTTVDPGFLAARQVMRVVIGGDGAWVGERCGGLSYVGSFYNSDPNTSYVFSMNLAAGYPSYVAEAAAHEAGHGFGLEHQSRYDAAGYLVDEYSPGDGEVAPLMGNSYDATRGLWWNGPTTSPTEMQDDMAMLAGTQNGFGYRADDHGNSIGTADALRVSGNQVNASGLIEKTSDADWFSFMTGAGVVSFTVDVAAMGPMLDAKVQLVSEDGTVIASADTYHLGETLTASVNEGTYRLVVKSRGLYGDVGQYTLSGTIVPVDVATPEAVTGVTATARPAGQIWVAWGAVSGADLYVVERSGDGVHWSELATVRADAKGYLDSGLTVGTRYYYRVKAANAGGTSAASDAVSAVALPGQVPAAPAGLRVTLLATYRVKLTWVDNSNDETGFRIQWSRDGVKWYNLGRTTAGRTSITIWVYRKGRTYFRVSAFNQHGESSFSPGRSAVTGAAAKRAAVTRAEPIFSVRRVKKAFDF